MTRYIYGASGASQVVSLTGVPQTASATVYTARTGGSTVTDIQNISGGALAGVVTPDSFGHVIFLGPDNFTSTVWLDFGSGPRWAVNPIDTATVVSVTRAALALAEKATPSGTTTHNSLPYTTGTIGESQMALIDNSLTPRFSSSASRNAAFPSPADGDRVRRTDTHLVESYNGGLSRWVPDSSLISEIVLGNSTTNLVTFSSIPVSYKHLRVIYHGRATSGGGTTQAAFQSVRMRFNGDSTTGNYHYATNFRRNKKVLSTSANNFETLEDGTGGFPTAAGATSTGGIQAGSDGAAGVTQMPSANPAGTVGYIPGYSTATSAWGGGEVIISNYAQATNHGWNARHGWAASDGTTMYQTNGQSGGTWMGSAAINSITFYLQSSNLFTSGTIISLYGWG